MEVDCRTIQAIRINANETSKRITRQSSIKHIGTRRAVFNLHFVTVQIILGLKIPVSVSVPVSTPPFYSRRRYTLRCIRWRKKGVSGYQNHAASRH